MRFTITGVFSTCVAVIVWSSAAKLAPAAAINELRVDQPGGDIDEYFELFGVSGESLDGLSFLSLQDNGTIDGLVDLDGLTIPADGYFLAAEATFTLAPTQVDLVVPDIILENGENSTYLLLAGFTGMVGTDLDADDDGTLESMPWTSIVDGVALVDDDADILNGGTEDIDYSAALGVPAAGPDGTFYPGHVFALPNGSDSYRIGGFTAGTDDTPGVANVPEPASLALMLIVGLGLAWARQRAG